MSDQFDHLEAARTLATIEIPDDAYQPLPLAARFATAHALIDIAESLRTTTAKPILFAAQPTVAEVKADAWDEGFATGQSRAMRHMSDEPSLPLSAPNPYRQEADRG